jgi:hypothetical protein
LPRRRYPTLESAKAENRKEAASRDGITIQAMRAEAMRQWALDLPRALPHLHDLGNKIQVTLQIGLDFSF